MSAALNLTPIERLAEILVNASVSCFIEEIGEPRPFQRLLVQLSDESADEPVILQIQFADDLLRASGVDASAPDGPDCVLLHFALVFPFDIRPGAMTEALRAAMVLNRSLALGFVAVDEARARFILLYQWAGTDREIPASLFAEIFAMLNFAASSHFRTLMEIAEGDMTAADLTRILEELGFDPGIDAAPDRPPAT